MILDVLPTVIIEDNFAPQTTSYTKIGDIISFTGSKISPAQSTLAARTPLNSVVATTRLTTPTVRV
ncbi:hypothetical protein DMJ13_10745 [halophilic archaeon]|nr:hypothetical protein DMJ13_10745 [halophilic archaeon]